MVPASLSSIARQQTTSNLKSRSRQVDSLGFPAAMLRSAASVSPVETAVSSGSAVASDLPSPAPQTLYAQLRASSRTAVSEKNELTEAQKVFLRDKYDMEHLSREEFDALLADLVDMGAIPPSAAVSAITVPLPDPPVAVSSSGNIRMYFFPNSEGFRLSFSDFSPGDIAGYLAERIAFGKYSLDWMKQTGSSSLDAEERFTRWIDDTRSLLHIINQLSAD